MTDRVWKVLRLWNPFEDEYLTLAEIGERLGISENSVSQRLMTFKNNFPDEYNRLKEMRFREHKGNFVQWHVGKMDKLEEMLEESDMGGIKHVF